MERKVPVSSSDEIDLYLRTIYSLLRSTNEVYIRSLEEVHASMNSSLHAHAREDVIDISAFLYGLLRLPDCIINVKTVILAQSSGSFEQYGYGNVETWQEVSARARRRRCFYDGNERLACYIASRTDIDDVIPCLTALQIEWNKLHALLNKLPRDEYLQASPTNESEFSSLAQKLHLSSADLQRLFNSLGERWQEIIVHIAEKRCDFRVRLLSGSLNDYRKATETWWEEIERHFPQIKNRPIYFVSSNTHSLANILSGFALMHQEEILQHVKNQEPELNEELDYLQAQGSESALENFLYYSMKKFLSDKANEQLRPEQTQREEFQGILRIPSIHAFDLEAQIIDLSQIDFSQLDRRLFSSGEINPAEWDFLHHSDALILNIDYPLGFSAYNLLTKIAENAKQIMGIYIMGKAASLNGVRGDVILPNVVYDEHSRNTYLFDNAFSGSDVGSYLNFGTVLDNQKAVTVLGTFLQNPSIMDVVYREGYTDIEMEAGPYLSAIYELFRPQRHPINEIVNLYKLPFDLGVLHYVSDTPLNSSQNLGAGSLSYYGMDSTYAVTLAILRRIMQQEKNRLA